MRNIDTKANSAAAPYQNPCSHQITPISKGAAANNATPGTYCRFIGSIDIFDEYCTVDLPSGMPKEVLATLQRAIVCNKPLAMTKVGKGGKVGGPPRNKKKGTSANRKAARANKQRDGFPPKRERKVKK